MHTTNYYNTFIEVAEDCPISASEVPPVKDDRQTVANLEYDMIFKNPYKYTSDDVLFSVLAIRNTIAEKNLLTERERFFSKGQPCLRSSPLTKRYGFGIHSDKDGNIALYPIESKEYKRLSADKTMRHLKAMRSKRK